MSGSQWMVCACAVTACVASAASAIETVGPFTIIDTPASASLIVGDDRWTGGDAGDAWLNVVNVPITVNEAFSGPGIADRGYANGGSISGIRPTVQMNYGSPVLNRPGFDLVVFDSRFSVNSYALSTDFDGFLAEIALPDTVFIDTGETRDYYFGANSAGSPFNARVMAAVVDLSDLGVPLFGSINSVQLRGTSREVDPLGVGVLPAPGALALTLVGGTCMLRRRR